MLFRSAAALSEIAPHDRRSAGPASALRAASRVLQRLVVPGQPSEDNPAAPAMAALERAEEALAEAETLLTRLAAEADVDPRLLEQAEERLFALRAAARKHAVAVADLPALLDTLSARLAALDTGAAEVVALEQAARDARSAYVAAAAALSAARQAAAARLDRAVGKELPPLRLDKARFHAQVAALAEADFSALKAASCCSVGLIASSIRCTGTCVKLPVCCLHKPPRSLAGASSPAIRARRYLVSVPMAANRSFCSSFKEL